jgi:hypothetical protein
MRSVVVLQHLLEPHSELVGIAEFVNSLTDRARQFLRGLAMASLAPRERFGLELNWRVHVLRDHDFVPDYDPTARRMLAHEDRL